MAEATTIMFSHAEIAEMLVKKQGIHEGIWGMAVQFGLGAMNIANPETGETVPAAFVPVVKIGIRQFDKENSLTVDAAKVNPRPEATESTAPSQPSSQSPSAV